jgi:hypothetical protein
LLDHVGQVSDAGGGTQPVFNFSSAAPRWTTNPAESAFQLQVALRYRF